MEISISVYLLLTVLVTALGMLVLRGGTLTDDGSAENLQLHSEMQPRRLLDLPAVTRQQAWNKALILMVFILLFGVSACRIAVGNDYWVYRADFLLIEQDRHVAFEPGFIFVVKALQAVLNHDQYLPIFAFFAFFTVLFFVRALEDQSEWFGYSVFLLMTAGYYFSSLNSVRYYLVLAIALYSMKYVLEGRYLHFILLICMAALFHKSVLVVIPLYLLANVKWKRIHLILPVIFCVSLVALPGVYRRIIFTFYPYYEGSMFDTGATSLTNIAKGIAVLIMGLIYYRSIIAEGEDTDGKTSAKLRFYFNCNFFALLLYVFASFIPEISRIGYYLNITHILFLPALIVRIKEKKQRIFWTCAITLAFLAYFALFLKSAYSVDVRILPYRNWIFQ